MAKEKFKSIFDFFKKHSVPTIKRNTVQSLDEAEEMNNEPITKEKPVAGNSFDKDESALGLGVSETATNVKRMSDWLSPQKEGQRTAVRNRMAANSLVPKDTPMRRRRNFVMSPQTIDYYADDFFKSNLKPLFEEERKTAEGEANKELDRFARNADMASSPFEGFGTAQRVSDPLKVIEKSMERMDRGKLDELSRRLAGYAGVDTELYRDKVLLPALRNRMIDDYVERGTSKNSFENVARNAMSGSLVGKLGEIGLQNVSGTDSWSSLQQAQRERYAPNGVEDFASGALSLALDMPLFGGWGLAARPVVGGATRLLTKRVAGDLMAKGIGERAAQSVAEKAITKRLSTKIAQSSIGQGITLGGFDATHNIVDQIMRGEEFKPLEAGASFAQGGATGIALGAVGAPLRYASRNLKGGAKALSNVGIFGTDAGVFTLAGQTEKLAQGVRIEPIDIVKDFGNNAATLLSMRIPHFVVRGAERKLDAKGEVRPELSFNSAELDELRSVGIDGESIEVTASQLLGTNRVQKRADDGKLRSINQQYTTVMNNPQISASTKGKLMYLVEDKLTSTPPVATDMVSQRVGDKLRVSLLDINGNPVERHDFKSLSDYRKFVRRTRSGLQQNRTYVCEDILQDIMNDRAFFKAACEVGEAKGYSNDEVGRFLFDVGMGRRLVPDEMQLLRELHDGAMKAGFGENAADRLRTKVEQENGMMAGTLKDVAEKPEEERSYFEEKALTQYLDLLEKECGDALPQGLGEKGWKKTGKEQLADNLIQDTPHDGIQGEAVVQKPVKRERLQPLFIDGESGSERRLRLQRGLYEREVEKMQQALGTKINLLYRTDEIVEGDEKRQWERQRSKGWYDKATDEVTVVMPNIRDVQDLQDVILHEAVGHRGLRNLFGSDFKGFLNDVYEKGDNQMKYAIDKIKKRRSCSVNDAVEEYICNILEHSGRRTAKDASLVYRMRKLLNSYMRRKGIRIRGNFTEHDLMALLHESRAALSDNPLDVARSKAVAENIRRANETDGNGGDGKNKLFKFLGETGIRNLEKDGDAGRMDGLKSAKEMERRGLVPVQIKYYTGWERGADDKWRYEIDDHGFNFFFTPLEKLKRQNIRDYTKYVGFVKRMEHERMLPMNDIMDMERIFVKYDLGSETVRLPSLVNDDMLFKAYPSLKKVKVVYTDELPQDTDCSYNHRDRCLYLNKTRLKNLIDYKGVTKDYSFDEARIDRETLRMNVLMELQKAIQYEEGFAVPVRMGSISPELEEEYEKNMQRAEGIISYENASLDSKDKEEMADVERQRADFVRDNGYLPDQFIVRYPTPNEYILHKLTKNMITQGAEEEMVNVARRRYMNANEIRNRTGAATERFRRDKQIVVKRDDFRDLITKGPIEIMREELQKIRAKYGSAKRDNTKENEGE